MRSASRGGQTPPLFKFRAYTLVEILVVLAIFMVLGGTVLTFKSSFIGAPSDETTIREGKYAAHWLQRIFYKALLSRRSFVFRVSSAAPQAKLVVQWVDNEKEVYDGRERVWFTNRSASPAFCNYSPQWHTISPAFTIEVGSSPNRRRPLMYIVVSPYCRVSYRDKPPGD